LRKKIKIGIVILLVAFIFSGWIFFLKEKRSRIQLEKEKFLIEQKLKLNGFKKAFNASKSLQRAHLVKKPTIKPSPKIDSAYCQKCFNQYKYELEVKDEGGRWIFKDFNVFDQTPGKLILTDKFWEEVEGFCRSKPLSSAQKKSLFKKGLRNYIGIGFSFNQYHIRYQYSPLIFSTRHFETSISFYFQAGFSYFNEFKSANAGLEVGFRF